MSLSFVSFISDFELEMAHLQTLHRDISPPPSRKISKAAQIISSGPPGAGSETSATAHENHNDDPTLAAIEAGEAQIRDHLEYFAKHLSQVSRPTANPLLSIQDFKSLYKRNQHKHGRHFVIHQHDHPVSGILVARILAV